MENINFNNIGLVKLNYEFYEPENSKTIFVVGLPRSGTSLISSILENINIFTGDQSLPPTYEDKHLKDLLDKEDWSGFNDKIRDYDSQHATWGFKLPRATYKIKEVIGCLRNPIILFTVRDPLSLQIRKNISQKEQNVFKGVEETLESYQRIFKDLESLSVPMLLVSYDKIQNNPRVLIEEIVNLCALENKICVDDVLKELSKDKQKYIENTRFDKTWGRVEIISDNKFSGYVLAQDPHRFDSLRVEVVDKNGKVIREVACHTAPDRLSAKEVFTDQNGEVIGKIFVKRNIRKFNSEIAFDLTLDSAQVIEAAYLRVSGDRKPFYYFS